jgi:hypothetical protein
MPAIPTAPFDPAKSIYNGLSVIQLALEPNITGVTAATDTLTKTAHGFTVGRAFKYVSGTGWTGLTAGDIVYVVEVGSSSTYKISETRGGSAISVGTSSAGVFTPIHIFEAPKLTDDPEQEMKYLPRPGFDGAIRNVRAIRTKSNERWMFDLEEFKRLFEISGGTKVFRKVGTCTLWIPDVDDSGTVALKSEDDFSVVVSRDGSVAHGGGEFSKAVIKIESLEDHDVVWSVDASLS